jgi:hypothetical protein
LLALRIIFQPCTPLQPFFLQGVCPGTLFTPPGYAPDKPAVSHIPREMSRLLREIFSDLQISGYVTLLIQTTNSLLNLFLRSINLPIN